MSASKSLSSLRGRLALMTGGSLAAVLLAPAAALAANECGPASGTQVCAGVLPEIAYTTTGNLTLQLQGDLVVQTGGLVVVGAGANTVTIVRPAINAGDPSLTSASTLNAALQVTRATAGGNINVNLTDNDTDDTPLAISGVAGGVRLANMGTSTTALTTTNGTIAASAGAGVDLSTTGTGALTLTSNSAVTGTTAGARLRTTGIGTITVTTTGSLTASAGAGLDLGTTGTGVIAVTNNGVVTGSTAAVLAAGAAAVTLTNTAGAELNGLLTLNNTGAATVSNNGLWAFSGTSLLGGGATTFNNAGGGRIVATNGSVLDFGAGADTLASVGRFALDGVVAVSGLETWNNSGQVLFGFNDGHTRTDGQTNDRLVYGGTFNGSGASELVMDVDFTADSLACAAVTADCFDLAGAVTTGVTAIAVNATAQGTAERIVLVDVAGGTSAAGHFVLAEPVDGGLFLYDVAYDGATRRHALVASDLGAGGVSLALAGRAASEVWRTATGLWSDRQAELRGRGAHAAGVWLKVAGGFIDETRRDDSPGGVSFDTSYGQETTAVVGGVDLIRAAGEDRAWVVGVTAGKVDSTLDFTVNPAALYMDGHALGAYASMLAGPAYLDAIVAATDLDLEHTALGRRFEGGAKSFGYELEGGWRLFQINDDGAWVEPIAALTYVRTEVDDLVLDQVDVAFGDATSLRAALGARIGGDVVMDSMTASFSATGRLWRELDGEGDVAVTGALAGFTLADGGVDNLGDLGVAASLFALEGRLSAHLAYNVRFKDDYQSTGASFGLRYNW